MKPILLYSALTLVTLTPFTLSGAEVPNNPNRLSFGPRFSLNYKADFKNKGAFSNAADPGLAIGGVDHTYNDGYVLVDSSGNLGGLTTNWGYQNASQDVGGGIEFNAIQSAGSSSASDDPQYGLELVYQRILGAIDSGSGGLWGLEVGFGYTDIDLSSHDQGMASVITDTYPIGVVPPSPGYSGTFSGPGALLGDTPMRALGSATVNSRQKLSGDLFSLRVGPFAEWQFTPKLSVAASVGLTLAPTRLDYDFSESATLASSDSFSTSGHASKTKLLYGGYVGAKLRYDLSDSWGIFAGAQFQSLTDMSLSSGGRTAEFDPSRTVDLSLGIVWLF